MGPAAAGLLVRYMTVEQAIYIMSGLWMFSVLLLPYRLPAAAVQDNAGPAASYRGLIALFQRKPLLFLLFLPTLGYGVLLGGLSNFLLWRTVALGRPVDDFSFLLTMHGLGAAVGSLVAHHVVRRMTPKIPLLTLFTTVRSAKFLWLLLLLGVKTFPQALVVLCIGGIPEVVGSVCFFTLIQRTLTTAEEAIFHSFSLPIFQGFVLIGTLLGGLYTAHWVTLPTYWWLVIGVAWGLATLPFAVAKVFKPSLVSPQA